MSAKQTSWLKSQIPTAVLLLIIAAIAIWAFLAKAAVPASAPVVTPHLQGYPTTRCCLCPLWLPLT